MSERDPMVGTNGADLITVDTSTRFQWVPDAGDSATTGQFAWNEDYPWYFWTDTTQPSTAYGTVTFNTPSSMSFNDASPSQLDFTFSVGGGIGSWALELGPEDWSWNPQTGALDPWSVQAAFSDIVVVNLHANVAELSADHGLNTARSVDLGHWVLIDNPIDVTVFGGAGNDTIYGGMGTETLLGEAGDDQIHVGRGEDTVLGGSGNDTIWGGVGTQLLMGEAGNDVIHAGTGAMTVLGGDGKDTLYGGTGTQFLSGGNGADWLYAGVGNETLEGGSGRDVFAFGNGVSGRDVISDFRIGTDVMQVAAGINGLAVTTVQDLRAHVTAGPGGVAVVTLGAASVTLTELSARQVQGHLSQVFRIG